jgi:hypothetical protein
MELWQIMGATGGIVTEAQERKRTQNRNRWSRVDKTYQYPVDI